MIQEIVRVERTCSKTLTEKEDEKLLEMNEKGFRLVSMSIIPAKKGCPPDAHGMSYGTNEQTAMIFEKEKG